MTDKEINIVIAKACGWTVVKNDGFAGGFIAQKPNGAGFVETLGNTPDQAILRNCPSYTTDLNAMHEAEILFCGEMSALDEVIEGTKSGDYFIQLAGVTERINYPMFHATALQRAEAFLRTIGKWRDG